MKNKYFNKKSFNKGMEFDSKKESQRFSDLLLMQNAGMIFGLQRQVKFEIVPKTATERAAFYIADFVYTRADGKQVIEDVKSSFTKTLPLYVLKRKLIKFKYPDYIFVET